MATQVSLNSGAVASAGALAIQTNGTTEAVSISTGQVATLAQNPILTSGTANGVAYLNGSKAVTSGSALTFDGTNFATTGTASATKMIPTGGSATGNGMYLPASNTLAWSNNGSETMRLDSAGNLGLGVTPSAWGSVWKSIDVGNSGGITSPGTNDMRVMANAYNNGTNWKYKNSTAASLFELNGGGFNWQIAGAGTAGNNITFTQAMTLDASGNLGIGSTAPSSDGASGYKNLVIGTSSGSAAGITMLTNNSGSTTQGIIWARSAAAVNGFVKYDHYNDALALGAAGSERARIDSSGNLLVGKTAVSSTTVGFQVTSDGTVYSTLAASTAGTNTNLVYSTGASAFRFYVGMEGKVYCTNTTITAISDQRLKENIQDLDVGLDKIMALKPRKFDWKAGKGKDKKGDRGWIAQEFEQVFPDMIDTWADPAPEGEEPYKAVNADLIPVLVKAIQEQQAIITQLQADVAALKGQA